MIFCRDCRADAPHLPCEGLSTAGAANCDNRSVPHEEHVEHVAIPLNCHHCGGPIEVACEMSDEASTQSVRFACPYCETPREFQAPGRVLWVAMRQPGDRPETRH